MSSCRINSNHFQKAGNDEKSTKATRTDKTGSYLYWLVTASILLSNLKSNI